MEIERKYIFGKFPSELKEVGHYKIEQIYISTEPEIRLRKKFNADGTVVGCKMTYKGNGDIQRVEIETSISTEFFDEMRNVIGHNPIIKDYRRYEYGNHILEVSEVDNGWFYGEIEFESAEEAESFKMDIEGTIDVTYDSTFKMKNYWTRTRLNKTGGI